MCSERSNGGETNAFARGLVAALAISAPFWLVLIGIGYLVIKGMN